MRTAPDSPPDVSLVVPVRNEAGNIAPLVSEIRTALDAAGLAWEAIVVDDGSTDGSWEEIAAAAAVDARVSGLRRERGEGKSAALVAGFARCRGASIVMLDGDGQDDPAEIPGMLALLADPARGRAGADLVNGWKTPRLDPWHKTLPSRVFNLLLGAASGLWLHDHNCGLKAFRAEVAKSLALSGDTHRFITVLTAAEGRKVVEKAVRHRPRTLGRSKYGFTRFVTGLVDLARISGRLRRGGRAVEGIVASSARARLRRQAYWIMGVVALAGLLGRIGAVNSVDRVALEKRLVSDAVAKAREAEAAGGPAVDAAAIAARVEAGKRLQRPFLSANDRSRWAAVRALVEKGTFAIDEIVAEPGWDTIDAVAHDDGAGRIRLYSSKPPLLSLLLAGPYWVLHRLTGHTLGDHPFELGRMLLTVASLLPFGLFLAATFRLVDSTGAGDWSRLWGAAFASFGTLLTPFAVSLTNHLPAAACTAWSAWCLLRLLSGPGSRGLAAATGALAALAAALELPALAWTASVLGLVLLLDPKRASSAVAGAVLVAAVALGANRLAHGSFLPPYAHRAAAPAGAAAGGGIPAAGSTADPANWYDYSIELADGRRLTSYWRDPKGVDRGEPSALRYAFHALIGHHGIFALTPAWLLLPWGLARLATPWRRHARPGHVSLALSTAAVTLVVLLFYLTRSQIDRNYGGVSSGFRWVLWLVPLWIAAVVPAVDGLARSGRGRFVALLLLAASVVSAAYPTWNPWSPPWIEQWMRHLWPG